MSKRDDFSKSIWNKKESKGNFIKSHGSALFFSISGSKDCSLRTFKVKDKRVTPHDSDSLLPGSLYSGPLFLECRNYFELPKLFKGMMCAFVTPAIKEKWFLGYVNQIKVNTQEMQLFVWRGPMVYKPSLNSVADKVIYPSYFFKSRDQLCSISSSGTPDWFNHFYATTVNMKYFSNFRFINQVWGIMPKSWFWCHAAKLNKIDGGYEQSSKGPDLGFVLPAKLSASSFPSMSIKTKLFIVSNDWSYLSLKSWPDIIPSDSLKLKQKFSNKKRKIMGDSKITAPPFLSGPNKITLQDVPLKLYYIADNSEQNVINHTKCFCSLSFICQAKFPKICCDKIHPIFQGFVEN